MQVFQQDNDPKHKAIIVSQWFQNNAVSVVSWPSQSPDLNPIENLWSEVERRLKGRKYKEPNGLFNAVAQAWATIEKDRLEKLVESMPRRCKAVIDAGGYATKY